MGSPKRGKTCRLQFTMRRLMDLEPPERGRVFHHDMGCPGLCLCVTAAGRRTFYVYTWHDGRPVQVRIAGFPEINVEVARGLAKDITAKLAKGINVQAAKQARREEATLGDLWADWLAWAPTRADKPKRPRSMQEDVRNWKLHLSHWANRRLSTITEDVVEAWHARVGQTRGPIAANRSAALLSAMFNRAAAIHWHAGRNPCKGMAKFGHTDRDRFLQGDELPRFFAALAEERDPFPAFFALCLLTGARKGNVMAMRWSDANLDSGLWRIPGEVAKAGEVIVIPLLPQAVEILRRRRETADDSPWVFPGCGKTGHLTEAKTAWARILKRAALADVHIHDLRRTMGSFMARQGASLLIVGKALGHRSQASTAIYARLQVDPVRAAMTAGAQAMFDAAGRQLAIAGPDAQTIDVTPADVAPDATESP